MTRFVGLVAAVLAWSCIAQAVEVKLTVTETAKVARDPAVVTTGVPFARGQVKDLAKLAVTVAGKPAPAQFTKLSAWDDGSLRWALLDVQAAVPASGKVELTVSDAGGANPPPPAPAKTDDAKEAVTVSTGPLQFVVSKTKGGLFQSLKVDGKELVTAAGRGPVIFKEGGGEVAGVPTAVTVEQAGPLRAVVCVRGKFPGIHNELMSYTARLSAFAGQKLVKVHIWLENNGAVGYFEGSDESPSSKNVEWFTFDGMAVELGLALGDGLTAACESASAGGNLKVLQVAKKSKALEKAPRGTNWKPPYFSYDDLAYTISSGGKELATGDRTDGVMTIKGGAGAVTVATRNFWEQYEKAIELDGSKLSLWLWPTEGQWPRIKQKAPFDKSLDNVCKDGLYSMQGGVHKGHEFVLDFSGRDSKVTTAELSLPLYALASADYYATTEAAPGLFAPPAVRTGEKECDARLDAWMRMTASVADPASPTSIFTARQQTWAANVGYNQDSAFWFGWMDFGEMEIPGRGATGLAGDWTWIALLNAMRTGDPNFMRLGGEMARHRIDVDQFWSDRDLESCRALQRGGYNWTAFHCYRMSRPPGVGSNYLAGVVLYHMLTGEPKALECCLRNGQGLKAAWKLVWDKKPYGGPQTDMAANAWSMDSYMAMYDLTADKAWLDEAVKLFTTDVIPAWKSQGPFLHGRDQIQSQDYIQTDQKYCLSIRSLCMLQYKTGDEQMLKLLVEGTEKEFPDTFFQAPLFLSDLYAYVALKTGNKELLGKAAELMAQGFPESKSPPVYLPGNSTWDHDSARALRAGHLLQYANWKMKK